MLNEVWSHLFSSARTIRQEKKIKGATKVIVKIEIRALSIIYTLRASC